MSNVIVIGAGPAGILAACMAAENNNNNVTILEKNDKIGKKLFITGKGRCNVTNDSDPENLILNTVSNPHFMYSSFYSFSSQDLMQMFENLKIPLKVERGNRVFPVSDKSSDILKGLERLIEKNKVKVRFNTEVQDVVVENNAVVGVKILSQSEIIVADNVIIATGGLSYPRTGSTGDGFKFAKNVGHSVTKLYPSLVALIIEEDWVKELQGLSLKNIGLKAYTNKPNSKKGDKQTLIVDDFGEMLFTHFGISGPLILTASRVLIDKHNQKPQIFLDLKPALTHEELDKRILRDFTKYTNKDFRNALDDLFPQKIIPIIIKLSGIDPYKKVNIINKDERKNLVDLIKKLTLTVIGSRGYNEAVVTCGGVSVKEIDPATMKSKLIDGLSFAGEVLDVDAYTGGYNLQIAFSTGWLAGKSI